MRVPPLDTTRLLIRPLTMDDLDAIYELLDVDLAKEKTSGQQASRDQRKRWLQWTSLSYDELAHLKQPPYGDRAIVLKKSAELIGACGYVPCLNQFSRLPAFHTPEGDQRSDLMSAEVGLYWAVSTRHRGQGYATEAGRALIEYGFSQLRLRRIVATTTFENVASIAVMRKLGMAIQRNPFPHPAWLQVVGFLHHPTVSTSGLSG